MLALGSRYMTDLQRLTNFEICVCRAGAQVYREVADGLVWSGGRGGVVRAQRLEPGWERKANVSWAAVGLVMKAKVERTRTELWRT